MLYSGKEPFLQTKYFKGLLWLRFGGPEHHLLSHLWPWYSLCATFMQIIRGKYSPWKWVKASDCHDDEGAPLSFSGWKKRCQICFIVLQSPTWGKFSFLKYTVLYQEPRPYKVQGPAVENQCFDCRSIRPNIKGVLAIIAPVPHSHPTRPRLKTY